MLKNLRKANDKVAAQGIHNFEGQLIASGNRGQLYVKSFTSCDYLFLEITILGTFRVTVNELKVKFSDQFEEKIVEADQRAINTRFSNSMNVGLTKFDVLLDDELIEFIRSNDLTTITVLELVPKGWWKVRIEEVSYEFRIEDLGALRGLLVHSV